MGAGVMDVKINASVDIDSIMSEVEKKLKSKILKDCKDECDQYASSMVWHEMERALNSEKMDDVIHRTVRYEVEARAKWEIGRFFEKSEKMSDDYKDGVCAGFGLAEILQSDDNIEKILEYAGDALARRIRVDSRKCKAITEALKESYKEVRTDEN